MGRGTKKGDQMDKKKKNWSLTKSYKLIKSDLLDQMEINGVDGEYYLDLINQYMSLWVDVQELDLDVKERGVSVKYQNSPTQWGYKKNDSLDLKNRTLAQMMRILDWLNLKPTIAENSDEDDYGL